MPQNRTRRAPPWRRTWALAVLGAALTAAPAAAQQCVGWVAYVSAIDQPIWYNRLGAHDPAGMMFALDEDVVQDASGKWRLRAGKRPRPLVLRVREGDCLIIHLTNRLSPTPGNNQPGTRDVSIHITGMQVKDNITNDGTNVGLSSGVGVGRGSGRGEGAAGGLRDGAAGAGGRVRQANAGGGEAAEAD